MTLDLEPIADNAAPLARLRDDGHGIIAVTHDDDFVAALADSVHRLERAA